MVRKRPGWRRARGRGRSPAARCLRHPRRADWGRSRHPRAGRAGLRVRHRIHAVRDHAHLDTGAVEIAPRAHQMCAVDRVPFGDRRAGPRDRIVGQRDFINDIEGCEVVQRRCGNPGLNHSPAGVHNLDPRAELTELRQRVLGCRVHVEVDLYIAGRVDTNQLIQRLILRLIRWRRRLRFGAVDERLTRDATIRVGRHLRRGARLLHGCQQLAQYRTDLRVLLVRRVLRERATHGQPDKYHRHQSDANTLHERMDRPEHALRPPPQLTFAARPTIHRNDVK